MSAKVAIVGRPNVGKSTLLNALVGEHVSITSRKPQTTRDRVLGVLTRGTAPRLEQFVFVDTPGFQTRHGNALNKSLNKTVMGAVNDVDLIVFVVEAGHFNLADAKVLSLLPANVPVILLANKFDLVHRRGDLAPWLRSMQERRNFAEFVPMSAKASKDIQRLFAICAKYLPQQPWMHDPEELQVRERDLEPRLLVQFAPRRHAHRLAGLDMAPRQAVLPVEKPRARAPHQQQAAIALAQHMHPGRNARMHQCLPVLPKPSAPRRLASKLSTRLNPTCSTGTTTSWAMRSMGCMVKLARPRFHTDTKIWPW